MEEQQSVMPQRKDFYSQEVLKRTRTELKTFGLEAQADSIIDMCSDGDEKENSGTEVLDTVMRLLRTDHTKDTVKEVTKALNGGPRPNNSHPDPSGMNRAQRRALKRK